MNGHDVHVTTPGPTTIQGWPRGFAVFEFGALFAAGFAVGLSGIIGVGFTIARVLRWAFA